MSISQPEFVQVQFVWLTLTLPVQGEELMDLGYESSCSSFPFLYFYLLAPLQKDIFSVLLITEQPASPLSCLCHSWFVSCLDSNLYIFRRGGGTPGFLELVYFPSLRYDSRDPQTSLLFPSIEKWSATQLVSRTASFLQPSYCPHLFPL